MLRWLLIIRLYDWKLISQNDFYQSNYLRISLIHSSAPFHPSPTTTAPVHRVRKHPCMFPLHFNKLSVTTFSLYINYCLLEFNLISCRSDTHTSSYPLCDATHTHTPIFFGCTCTIMPLTAEQVNRLSHIKHNLNCKLGCLRYWGSLRSTIVSSK